MVGKGSEYFAVMGYIIAKQRPNRSYGSVVELNPRLLAMILGESEADVRRVIDEFCEPDELSRSKAEGGRKLVKIDEYGYRVVNGTMYREMRDAEERREYQRVKQAEYRAKKKEMLTGEAQDQSLERAGASEEERERAAAATLPENCQ